MTTATVTGVFKTLDGAVYPNRAVVFEAQRQGITSASSAVWVPDRKSVTTDSNGAISVPLLRGRVYSLRVNTATDGLKYGALTVPDEAGPFDLADLIDNGAVPVIPSTPPNPTTAYEYATRAAFVAAGLTGLDDGTLVSAGGLFYVRSTGASAIADLSGWLPHGTPSPAHFATNATPGTTDMAAAVLACFTYANTIGGPLDGSTVGAVIDGRGERFAIGSEVTLNNVVGVTCRDCYFSPVGTWAADTQMFKISRDTGDEARRLIRFENCTFEGLHVTNAALVENASGCGFLLCRFHGTPDFAIRSRIKATELRIEGCDFRQYYNGETGWNLEANRTAALIDIDTADYMIFGNVAAYAYENFKIGTRGPGQMFDNHFYNGGLTDATQNTRNGTISGPNAMVRGNYFDNGLVRIDASVLDGNVGMSIVGNFWHKNGNATNTNELEFFNGSNSNMSGLVLASNVFQNSLNAVLFTGTYAPFSSMLWAVSGNITKNGGRIAGIPVIAARNIFYVDSIDGSGWLTPSILFSPGDGNTTALNFRRSVSINADHDNNSGDTQSRGTLSADAIERFRWDDQGVSFFNKATVAKQTVTGSRGGNAALQSLLTALANYGLITDSTS